MSARKAAEDETPADAGEPPINLIEVAIGPALEHRAYAAAVAHAMALSAENTVAAQQTGDQIGATVTGKSVNRILTGPLPGLVPSGESAETEFDPDSQKET
jgi:hypothetical protein